MINKQFKIFMVLVSFTTLSISCIKSELKPTDTISPEKAYRNIADVNLGLLGAYAIADYTMFNYSSTVSDENTYPLENTATNSDAFRWLYNSLSTSVTGMYGSNYVGIDRINRTLAGLNVLTLTGTDASTANRYRGELLALRAYYHFELLRAYASAYEQGALGVPYMKVSAIAYPARDKFESVIADAKADLMAAKDLIPASFTDKTRITKTAVSAMQARVALYEKNWADAITYSTEVINALPLATKAQFPGLWTDANSSEVAWFLKRVGTQDSRVGDFYFRQTGGIALYTPSFKLINTFDKVNDLRYPAYIKFDATRLAPKSQYLVNKYIGGTPSTPGLVEIKLFRTGEMYLIRAEARAETSGDAAGDINTLRAARINNYVNAVFGDKTALLNAIDDERFKELAFEGHRFFDLRRRKLPVVRTTADIVNASGALTLPITQAQYTFPIPAVEISVNKNTVQNPFYN